MRRGYSAKDLMFRKAKRSCKKRVSVNRELIQPEEVPLIEELPSQVAVLIVAEQA